MTITYNLDVPHFGFKGILSILFRWRGSVWAAISVSLVLWLICFYIIVAVYYFLLNPDNKQIFDKIVDVLKERTDSILPMTFILGFFVSSVVQRWQNFLNNIGWIDTAAISLSVNLPGNEGRIIRRTIIRYLVLSQTLVLRNLSIQVRRRFPNFDAIEAADLITNEERILIEETKDICCQFFMPIVWAGKLINDARKNELISSDVIANSISSTLQSFQTQLQTILRHDWVPLPLVYPQLVAFCVRFYFFICLFTRQIITSNQESFPKSFLFWIPLPTIVEFVIYMGWLNVAEELLHPLGEEYDNLECNYIIDRNLIFGLSMVDKGGEPYPKLKRDAFMDTENIAPLYNYDAAKRSIYPLIGSAANVNMVKNVKEIVMVPHKSKLFNMSTQEEMRSIKKIDVVEYNRDHKADRKKLAKFDENKKLKQLIKSADGKEFDRISIGTPLLNDPRA